MEKSWQIAERIWSAALTPTEKLVALAVLRYRNWDTGLCFPSRERIASDCRVSIPTVARALHVLKKCGMVEGGGYLGRFRLLRFVPSVQLGVMSITHDTPPVSPVTPQRIFRAGVGEELEEDG